MLSKLPANFIQHEVDLKENFPRFSLDFYEYIRKKLRNMSILNPMIIVLRQEIHRINRVIGTIRNSLNDLRFKNCDKIFEEIFIQVSSTNF